MNLELSTQARDVVSRLKTNLGQATLLAGPSGVGLLTIASHLAKTHGSVEFVRPEKLTKTSSSEQIGVETVRELYNRTRGKSKSRRVVIIDEIEKMTLPAQNSFLKLLEEPPTNMSFILTSHFPDRLLGTIRSRVQLNTVLPLSLSQTSEFLDRQTLTPQKRAQLQFIASGLPAELYRLIGDEHYYRRRASSMESIKTLLSSDSYDRTCTIYKHATSKDSALELIDGLLLVLKRYHDAQSIAKIARILEARESILANGNPRLQLMAAML